MEYHLILLRVEIVGKVQFTTLGFDRRLSPMYNTLRADPATGSNPVRKLRRALSPWMAVASVAYPLGGSKGSPEPGVFSF